MSLPTPIRQSTNKLPILCIHVDHKHFPIPLALCPPPCHSPDSLAQVKHAKHNPSSGRASALSPPVRVLFSQSSAQCTQILHTPSTITLESPSGLALNKAASTPPSSQVPLPCFIFLSTDHTDMLHSYLSCLTEYGFHKDGDFICLLLYEYICNSHNSSYNSLACVCHV